MRVLVTIFCRQMALSIYHVLRTTCCVHIILFNSKYSPLCNLPILLISNVTLSELPKVMEKIVDEVGTEKRWMFSESFYTQPFSMPI
jgi:hypothetical protein